MRLFPYFLLAGFACVCGALRVYGQGSLTPAGAPGPVFKTLSQVEPRTPISATGVINAAGSYYLTTNIVVTNGNVHGIHIITNNVTLDLNGFALIDTTTNGSASGIEIGAIENVWIRNGSIRGFARGIQLLTESSGIRIEDVYVAQSRVQGIFAFALSPPRTGSVSIARCIIEDMGLPAPTTGGAVAGINLQRIRAVVEDCTVRNIRSGVLGPGTGIIFGQPTDSIALRNKLIQCPTGMNIGAGTAVAFRDNITIGCATPFSGGGIDKGNNN